MDEKVPGFLEWHEAGEGRIPRVAATLRLSDRLGAWKARWGIGRMRYMVPAGLYAIGAPSPQDPVVVTANYKMSYDLVRRQMAGGNLWLLVLETFGVNVWCAAGKGTFGTDELVGRIEKIGLARLVSHRRLILPMLGATGVAAHEVKRRTGFTVNYGPIRAADLPEYLDNGLAATPQMRELSFTLRERLALVPLELLLGLKPLAVVSALLLPLFAFTAGPAAGVRALVALLGAVLTGTVLGPLLLPWLPGRSFACKGALAGFGWALTFLAVTGFRSTEVFVSAAALLALPAISAFHTLNFTGCTPFASRSGVKKEMRLAFPVMAGAVLLGGILLLAGWLF